MADTAATKTKEYIRPIPAATWWVQRPTYVVFMIREATSLFVGGYALFLLTLVARADDAAAFAAALQSPLAIALQLLALPMVVFHAVTWFNAAPKALVLYRGEERVSPAIVGGAHYVAWLVVSGIILWIVSWYR